MTGKTRDKRARDARWHQLRPRVLRWLHESGTSRASIAARVGLREGSVQRWFDLDGLSSPTDENMNKLEDMMEQLNAGYTEEGT